MPAVQYRMPLIRPRLRSVRRAFHPSAAPAPYRLPHDVRDRLAGQLQPYRNREAAFALAVFLARFWSTPGRVAGAFPVDRRALADHGALDLTEARVRGALRVLCEIGFITPTVPPSGSRYRATVTGLQRKAVLYGWGPEAFTSFVAANKRAAAARGRRERVRGCQTPVTLSRPPMTFPAAPGTISPKSKGEAVPVVLMGEVVKRAAGGQRVPPRKELDSQLGGALERLRRAIEAKKE